MKLCNSDSELLRVGSVVDVAETSCEGELDKGGISTPTTVELAGNTLGVVDSSLLVLVVELLDIEVPIVVLETLMVVERLLDVDNELRVVLVREVVLVDNVLVVVVLVPVVVVR